MLNIFNECMKIKPNRMTVIRCIEPFIEGSIINIPKLKSITDYEDLFITKLNGRRYVVKKVNDDEWKMVKYILSKNNKCDLLIQYYACLRMNKNKYIIMEYGKMDLEDYFDNNHINKTMIYSIIESCFNFIEWTIKNFNLVHIDIKLKNLLYINETTIKIIDLELMEKPDAIYYHKKEKSLLRESIDNQMYPRRKCTYLQYALFSIVILIMEVFSVCDALIVARKNDDKLIEILEDLAFFNKELELLELFKNIINFEYDDIYVPFQHFLNIKNTLNNNRFILD